MSTTETPLGTVKYATAAAVFSAFQLLTEQVRAREYESIPATLRALSQLAEAAGSQIPAEYLKLSFSDETREETLFLMEVYLDLMAQELSKNSHFITQQQNEPNEESVN